MIYQALYQLAEREQLVDDIAYETAPVAYLIKLGVEGKYFGYSAPRLAAPVDKKGKPRGRAKPKTRPIPRRSESRAGSKPPAEFLVDNPSFVFGVEPSEKFDFDTLAERKKRFTAMIEEAQRDLNLLSLRALLQFLNAPLPGEIQALLEPDSSGERAQRSGEAFAFVYEPDGGLECIHDDRRIRAWFLKRLTSSDANLRGQCLVTGENDALLTRLHGKPKNIPPKSKTKGGVPLTSVNHDAFKSYKLDDVQCAPISREASVKVETALNRMLDPNWKKPDGSSCERRSVVLSADTVILYWSKEDAAIDWFGAVEHQSPETIAALLHSPYKERSAPIDDPSAFYALILSGGQGRAIVRSFLQSTVAQVAGAIDRYREEVRIVKPYGEAEGSFGLLDYRKALVPRRDLNLLPPALATDLYLSIVCHRPFPQSILQAIVRRFRAESLPKVEKSERRDDMLLAARCSLLKAFLIRNLKKEDITVALDRERKDSYYRLGRLLAVIDRLQQDALGNVNATLVDRYYGSASSTPEAVFPTLLRRSQHHLAKLRREKPGLAVNTDKLLQEVVSDMERFPKTMTLEQQGLFALGFYQQRQDLFTKKERN